VDQEDGVKETATGHGSGWREEFRSLSHAPKKSVQVASSTEFNIKDDWFKNPLFQQKVVSSLQITCPRMLCCIR
jgi:hypothetical protein